MKDSLVVSLLSVVPRRHTSRVMGWLSRLRLVGFLRRALLRWYVSTYGVNLDECEGRLEDYPSLAEFFVRPLRPGLRPVCADAQALVSPADGVVAGFGDVTDGSFPQGDGVASQVGELLGGAEGYADGHYAIIYLAPKDYHRVHSPLEGRLRRISYRPGAMWPVFPAATRKIRDLFARNERLLLWLDLEPHTMVVAMIAAFGVGRMETPFASLVTNTGIPAAEIELAEAPQVVRGAEVGRFGMGSTVVLLLPKGSVTWELSPGQGVRVGERIGRLEGLAP